MQPILFCVDPSHLDLIDLKHWPKTPFQKKEKNIGLKHTTSLVKPKLTIYKNSNEV